MVNRKIIAGVIVFVATGFLIFSFAATPDEKLDDTSSDKSGVGTVENNKGNSSTNNNIPNNENGTTNDIPSGNLDDDKNDALEIIDGTGQNPGTEGNNSGSTNKPSSGSSSTGNNSGSTNKPSSGSSSTGNNSGSTNKPSSGSSSTGNNSGSTNKPSSGGSSTGNNSGSTNKPSTDENKVVISNFSTTTSGVSASKSSDQKTITFTGTIDKEENIFSINKLNVQVKAPDKYSNEILKNMYVKFNYSGQKYDASILKYDSNGLPYIEFVQEFSPTEKSFNIDIYWGTGEVITYTIIIDVVAK